VPYLIRNTFQSLVLPLLVGNITAWDNLSQDKKISKPDEDAPVAKNVDWYKLPQEEKDAVKSREDCEDLCRKKVDCLQWKFKKGQCHLGMVVRLGRRTVPKEKDTEETVWTSGWMVDKITKATEEWGKCDEANWKFNQ
jgi:hypothetical protein